MNESPHPEVLCQRPAKCRAFFALPINGDAAHALLAAGQRMQQLAGRSRLTPRWQPAEKLHVTLSFLGWVEQDVLDSLWPFAMRLITDVPPIAARVDCIGAFPKQTRARVLVAEVSDERGRLSELASALASAAAEHGIASEDRQYRPHVTLARIKRPGNVSDWITRAALEPTLVHFDELRLYRSDLTPHGGLYSVLERAPFSR